MASGKPLVFEIAHGFEEAIVADSDGHTSTELTHVIAVRPSRFDAERIAARIRKLFPHVGVELDHHPQSDSIEFLLELDRRNDILKGVRDLTRRSVASFVANSQVNKVPGEPVQLRDARSVFEVIEARNNPEQ